MQRGQEICVVVHGGAGGAPSPERVPYKLRVLESAVSQAWSLLEQGGDGAEAVAMALRTMEASGFFHAGRGGPLNESGERYLDASIMRGDGVFSSIMHAGNITFPSMYVLDELGARGEPLMRAWTSRQRDRVAASTELRERYGWVDRLDTPETQGSPEPPAGGHDTVGCLVRDAHGRVWAGGSTSGTPGKPDGRVGDSPIPGAGLYADNRLGALAATGKGEKILRSMVSALFMARVKSTLAADADAFAADDALGARMLAEELAAMQARYQDEGGAGIIFLPPRGKPSWAFCTRSMTVAAMRGKPGSAPYLESHVLVRKD